MNEVIITKNATNKTVEFKRINGADILETKVFPNGFEVVWRPSIDMSVFSVFAGENNFIIAYREIDQLVYTSPLVFYNFLRDLADYSSGAGGGGDATAANQVLLLNQDTPSAEMDYFNFSDIENPLHSITFPLTCVINATGTTGESIPSATYADFDALITAFNSGIALFKIEKRTEDSFYVIAGTASINKETETFLVSFNDFPATRVFRFFSLNRGAYPSSEISVSRTANELQKSINGIGQSTFESHTLAGGFGSIVFYAWKNITIETDAPSEEIRIESLDGSFSAMLFPHTNSTSGEVVTGINEKSNVVQKIPIKVTNLGASASIIKVLLTQ